MPSADPITQTQVLNQVKKHKTIRANSKCNNLMQENQGVGKGIEPVQFQSITVSEINSIIISIDVKKERKKESIK